MAVSGAVAGGGAGIAVERAPELLAIVVGHHGELELDRLDTVELRGGVGDPTLDLALQRAAGNGQRDEHPDDTVVADLDAAQHAELDDGAVELRVLDGSEGFDDLFLGDCHADQCGSVV